MSKQIKKCSNHKEKDAKFYCPDCSRFMCQACETLHKQLLSIHNLIRLNEYELDPNYPEFRNFCEEENHGNALDYFCSLHNMLCCIVCFNRIGSENLGKHRNCLIKELKDVENEKKELLQKNLDELKKFEEKYNKSLRNLKATTEAANNRKSDSIKRVGLIFEELRANLDKREADIIEGINKNFQNLMPSTERMIEYEKFPEKIKYIYNQGTDLQSHWNNEKLRVKIQRCINIENLIKNVSIAMKEIEIIEKKNLVNNFDKIVIREEEKEILNYKIMVFGEEFINFEFKECPADIEKAKMYKYGENKSVVTFEGSSSSYIPAVNLLKRKSITKWKIDILNTHIGNIMVGVAPYDLNSAKKKHQNYGWYFFVRESSLCSGPPHEYYRRQVDIKKYSETKTKSIKLIMDTISNQLFINVNDKEEEDVLIYDKIPEEKDLVPVVILSDKGDTVQILPTD